jgi:hypothetical protein
MPRWTQIIIGAAAVLGAIGIIWAKLLRPLGLFIYKFVLVQREILPLLQTFAEVFKDNPNAFKVLDEIVAQFRTDSGSSLRDVVNRIEEAGKDAKVVAESAKAAAEELKLGVATAKQMDERDRVDLRTLMLQLDRIGQKVGVDNKP